MRSLRLCCVLLAGVVAGVVVGVAGVGAQPRQGDVILGSISGTTGVFSVDWQTGTLRTVRAGVAIGSIQTAFGNGSIIASRAPSPTVRILRITPTGLQTTLISFAGQQNPRGWVVDQSGAYFFGSSDNRLYRMPLGGRSVSTFASIGTAGGRFINAMCRDGERGFFLVGTASPNQLLRVNRVNGAVTTFVASLPAATLSGVDYIPSSGDFVVSTFSSTFLVRTGGAVRTTVAVSGSMVTCDERQNRIFVCDVSGFVHELGTNGAVVRSRNYLGFGWSCIEVFDDQNVSLTGTAVAGSTNTVSLSFRKSPNRGYCAAVSLQPRPSIVFGGQYLNLGPDAAFTLTACRSIPGLTGGFAGRTDSGGNATATVTVPRGLPAGVGVHVGAVAINPAAPSSIDVGNTELLLTR